MTVPKIVIHTDVFLAHLCGSTSPSALRVASGKFFCYTTVFQAIELFGAARTARERRAVENVLAAVKLLGLNARTAPVHGRLLGASNRLRPLSVMAAGICLESGLPLLSDWGHEFRGVRGLLVVPTAPVFRFESGRAVLAAVRRRQTRPQR